MGTGSEFEPRENSPSSESVPIGCVSIWKRKAPELSSESSSESVSEDAPWVRLSAWVARTAVMEANRYKLFPEATSRYWPTPSIDLYFSKSSADKISIRTSEGELSVTLPIGAPRSRIVVPQLQYVFKVGKAFDLEAMDVHVFVLPFVVGDVDQEKLVRPPLGRPGDFFAPG
ncbi:hypothetical protein D3C87_1462790 [compost metagenome]